MPPPTSAASEMVWCGARNGRRAEQSRARRQQAGDRVDRRHLERFVERQRRQNARQPARQHRLARAGRADEQQVVAAGRGDLERPPRQRLPAHVGQVDVAVRARRHVAAGSAAGPARRALGCSARTASASDAHGQHAQAGDDGGFRCVARGSSSARVPSRRGRDGDRQHAARRAGSCRRATARRARSTSRMSRRATTPVRREDAERDRQIERRARLAHVGRRQIHRDAMRRETRSPNCGWRARTRSRLSRTLASGKPDHGEDRAGRTRRRPRRERGRPRRRRRRRCAGSASTPCTLQAVQAPARPAAFAERIARMIRGGSASRDRAGRAARERRGCAVARDASG